MQALRARVGLLAAALAACPRAARADEAASAGATLAKTRAVAIYVEGVEVDAARSDLAAAVPARIRVIEAEALAKALAAEGQRGAFGPALSHPELRARLLAKLRKAAAAAGADAVLVGRTRRENGAVVLRVLYIEAIQGTLGLDTDVRQTGAARREAIGKLFAAPLDELSPPAPPEPPPAAPPAPEAPKPRPERIPYVVGTARVVVGLGVEIGGRWFRYSDPITQNLRPYSMLGAPMPAIHAEVYPLAATSAPIIRELGLTVDFAHAFALASSVGKSGELATAWDRVDLGLRLRLRIRDIPRAASPEGSATSPVIGLTGGFGFDRFAVDAKGSLANEMPDAAYAFLRGGLDLRLPVWRFAFEAHGSWLGALSAGTVYRRFREPTLGGVDIGGAIAFGIGAGFEARAGFAYQRWFSAFAPVPGDAYVAGGALDERIRIHIGAAYAY